MALVQIGQSYERKLKPFGDVQIQFHGEVGRPESIEARVFTTTNGALALVGRNYMLEYKNLGAVPGLIYQYRALDQGFNVNEIGHVEAVNAGGNIANSIQDVARLRFIHTT